MSPEAEKPKPEVNAKESTNAMSSRIESLTIEEDAKEDEPEDEEGLPVYPFERLKTSAPDPVTGIDVTKREVKKLTVFWSCISELTIYIKISCTMCQLNTDILVFIGIQGEIRDDKGSFLQAAKMEAE